MAPATACYRWHRRGGIAADRAVLGGRSVGLFGTMLAGGAVGAAIGALDYPLGLAVAAVVGIAAGFFYAYAESLDMITGG